RLNMKVKTVGPVGAKIFLVGEAPGEEEDKYGKPFIGTAGHKLDALLAEAGISRHECLIGNVAKERPPGNKIDFFYEDKRRTNPKPILQSWINELKEEILMYNPNIIVALGDTAMYTLCGLRGISRYRGYITDCALVPGKKVLPTYHPQKTNYEWRLGFDAVMDLRKAVANSNTPDFPKDTRKLHSGCSFNEFMSYLDWLIREHEGPIALDVETTDPGCHIDIIGIAASPKLAASFQIINGKRPVLSPEKEILLWRKLAEVLAYKECIMQNGVFDMSVLWLHTNIFVEKFVFDTLIAGHVCWPERPRSLAYLGSICLNVPAWKHTAEEMPLLYNASDAANTYGIYEYMVKELDKQKLWNTFNFEMAQVYPAAMLQLQGVEVNTQVRDELKKTVAERLEYLDTTIEEMIGKKVNFNSPKQLQSLLYIDMRLPVQYKRRKSASEERKATADATALQTLSRKTDNPVLDLILEYKKLYKLTSSFLDMELSPRNRVHTSYNITGATMLRKKKGLIIDDEEAYKSFGRWSSSSSIILPYGSGNLQNIPKIARKIYTAPPGYLYLQADYMQAEAVVVAYEIGDEPAKLLFRTAFGLPREERLARHLDIHRLTAALMFQKQISEVTEEERNIGKRLRHATNYSAGPTVLANSINCTTKKAKELFAKYHQACPMLRLWHARIQDQLRRTRILTNLFGRNHRFLERWGDELFRSAYSFIPQSTVGDLLNKALIKLYYEYGKHLTIPLQLHDAVYFIIKETELETRIKEIRDVMLIPMHSSTGEEFIIDVDFSAGPSWGELEDL
ncbi:MAG: DNA polymerase, partial [Bacilli bacterium]